MLGFVGRRYLSNFWITTLSVQLLPTYSWSCLGGCFDHRQQWSKLAHTLRHSSPSLPCVQAHRGDKNCCFEWSKSRRGWVTPWSRLWGWQVLNLCLINCLTISESSPSIISDQLSPFLQWDLKRKIVFLSGRSKLHTWWSTLSWTWRRPWASRTW